MRPIPATIYATIYATHLCDHLCDPFLESLLAMHLFIITFFGDHVHLGPWLINVLRAK